MSKKIISTKKDISSEIEYERELYDKRYKEEIKRYSTLASKLVYNYWDREMLSALNISKSHYVLDYGCGIGVLTNKINSAFVVGIDISKSLISVAKRKSKKLFVICDGERLPFKSAIFDRIIGRGILHHLPNPTKAAKEIKKVIKTGGVIVFSEPNKNNLVIIIMRNILKIFHPLYSKRQKSFSPNYLEKLFPNAEISNFGFISYIFAFPDIVSIIVPKFIVEIFIFLDKVLSKLPLFKKFSWHLILKSKMRSVGV